MSKLPYKRLSGFYFFYFSLLGAMMPYWSLYLKQLNFDAKAIGLLMATLYCSRIFAPSLWGWLADKTGKRMSIIRWGAAATWLLFLGIFWQESAWGIGLIMLAYSFFWNAVLPQFEVVTLNHLGDKRERYSQIRVWGSIGFTLTVVALGYIFDFISVSWLPVIMLLLMIMIWLNACLVPAGDTSTVLESTEHSNGGMFLSTLCRPAVIAFFAATFLVQLSHGPYYTFFSVMLEDQGFNRSEIGYMWSLGVVAEVVAFIFMHRMIGRFGVRGVMLFSLLMAVVRWAVIALYPTNIVLLLMSQLLHAFTFGALHSTGVALVHNFFDANTQGRGQALFSSVGFGLGGTLGAVLSGMFWQSHGSMVSFLMASIICAVALILTYTWVYPIDKAGAKN